ncbi:MAG: hypothetical protein CSA34_03800 [Desulfobulbus propionicus]|nr:MAG: hypothetical protein CSA34_03800 [Desulfobulbus propionicus]
MEQHATHNIIVAYLIWIFGFIGAHRFYLGKPISGTIYLLTFGVFLVGWIVDLFLIPGMVRDADIRFTPGRVNFTLAWLLLVFLGIVGIHRMYMGKWFSGVLYLFTLGLFGFGYLFDMFTLNDQITLVNGAEVSA